MNLTIIVILLPLFQPLQCDIVIGVRNGRQSLDDRPLSSLLSFLKYTVRCHMIVRAGLQLLLYRVSVFVANSVNSSEVQRALVSHDHQRPVSAITCPAIMPSLDASDASRQTIQCWGFVKFSPLSIIHFEI